MIEKELAKQNEQLIADSNLLISQNRELKHILGSYSDEITYLKLREKKIMYLVHLLQGKGYPVTQIFEKHVKPINTLRFEEFLLAKEREAAREEELEREA